MTLTDLYDVKKELKRFEIRLNACIARVDKDKYALDGCKETAAVKRGALDLKNELTYLTK